MSALGHKRTFLRCGSDVRFTPESGHFAPHSLCARSTHRRDNPLPSYWLSAAASKSTFPNGVARLLAFAKELHIRHDWLVGMVCPPMRNVCFVIGNTNHQTRSSRAPITCGPHRTGGLVEQNLQIRHGDLPRLLRRARFPLRSAADCPALFGY